MTWPAAFALTLAVEVAVVVALARARRIGPKGRVVAAAVVVNVVSHPLLWFVLVPGLGSLLPFAVAVVVAELAVLALEGTGYVLALRIRPSEALLLTVAANAASFAAGLLLGQR